MRSFLCRVLSVIFLLNCLTPSVGWGQSSARRRNTRPLDQRVQARVQEADLKNSPAYRFFQADQQARTQHNEHFAQADQQARQAEQERMTQPAGLVWTPVSTRVAAPVHAQRVQPSRSQAFLRKVGKNEIPFDKLIDYADPLDPSLDANDLRTTAYAAEVIGNTVSQLATLDPALYDLSAYTKVLPEIEARLLYRLALLGFEAPSYTANHTETPFSSARAQLAGSFENSLDKILAVGTLRMTLLKINRFYKLQKQTDPVEDYQVHMLSRQLAQQPQALRPSNPEMGHPREDNGQLRQAPAPTAAQQQEAAAAVQKHGNLADFQRRFIYELREMRARKPEETSGDYYRMQVTAEYAAAYSMEYDPKYLKTIVQIFDEGVQKDRHGRIVDGDFKRTYAPIVNAVFNTIFENTRYAQMSDQKTKQILALLEEFSDPTKYSFPTRVAALEAASLLYRPFNAETLRSNTPAQPFEAFVPMNFNKPDEHLRAVFAARVVSLYCPLTAEFKAYMQTYGLDSEGMKTLADQLAYIYDGFYDISTTTISMPGQDPHHQPSACYIAMKNQPNRIKKNQEDEATALWWTANTLFFIFGGDVFQLLGTAFRLTRGAIAALPQAGRAFSLAQRGEKIAAFNNQIRNGAKFANWVYKNKKQQGYLVEFIVEKSPARVETKHVLEDGVLKTVKTEIPAVEESQLVTTTHQLQGKPSLFNPKRWYQSAPAPSNIVGMRVTALRPHLANEVGEMRFGEMVADQFVPKPVNGIHSLEELSAATRQLRTPSGDRFWMDPQPYWQGILNTNQALLEQSWLYGLKGLEKEFDILVPVINPAQTHLPVSAANLIGKEAKWWNLTSWGLPPKGFQMHKTLRFVAPKSKLNVVQTAQRLQAQGGLLNAPGRLPGFYTTQAIIDGGNLSPQLFNTFFRPLNWQNTLAKTFLPDYVPTAAFWKSIQANPVLGAKLLPNLLWRNRFFSTSAFFAAWSAADYGLHPALSHWIANETTKDIQTETAKYGDALTEKRAQEDKQLAADMGVSNTDSRVMQTYKLVTTAFTERSEGTLLAAISLPLRRAAGMEFITQAQKTRYAREAYQAEMAHAKVQKTHTQLTQTQRGLQQSFPQAELTEQQRAQWQQKQLQTIRQGYQNFLQQYPTALGARPKLKQKVDRLYQNLERDFKNTPTTQVKALNDRFLQQLRTLETEVAVWDKALNVAYDYMNIFRVHGVKDPSLITQEVLQGIEQAYVEYATTCTTILGSSATEEAQKEQIFAAHNRAEAAVSDLWEAVRLRYKQAHPEDPESLPVLAVTFKSTQQQMLDLADQPNVPQQQQLAVIRKAHQTFLEYYDAGMAAQAPLKERVDRLYREYEQNFLRTPAAQTGTLNEQFLQNLGDVEKEVVVWDDALKAARSYVETFQISFGQDPAIVTPELIEKVYQEYSHYADACVTILRSGASEEEQWEQTSKEITKLNSEIDALWDDLLARYKQAHPELSQPSEQSVQPAGEETQPVYGNPAQWTEPQP